MSFNVEIILKVKLYSLSIGYSDYPYTVNILGVVWWIVRRRDVSWWISIIKHNETPQAGDKHRDLHFRNNYLLSN